MMRVIFITKNLSPKAGIGRCSKGVVEHMTEIADSVSVFSEDNEMNARRSILSFVQNCLRARRAAKNFNVVHALDVWPYGIFALAAVLGTKKKLFLSGIGTYSVPPRKLSLKRLLFLWIYSRAQTTFCISAYTAKRIQERLPFTASLPVVHLGTDILPSPSFDAHEKFQISKKAYPVCITVGEVKERKGQKDTLEGIALLKNDFPDITYLVVGGQDDSVYIEKMKRVVQEHDMENQVHFISSAKNDSDLAALYAMSTIHLLNSNNDQEHFEGFGLVFLEANQFGVPGIGSKDCGIEDAIQDGFSGILVEQKGHQGIANAARTILSRETSFREGAKKWRATFSWKKTVKEYYYSYSI